MLLDYNDAGLTVAQKKVVLEQKLRESGEEARFENLNSFL